MGIQTGDIIDIYIIIYIYIYIAIYNIILYDIIWIWISSL